MREGIKKKKILQQADVKSPDKRRRVNFKVGIAIGCWGFESKCVPSVKWLCSLIAAKKTFREAVRQEKLTLRESTHH
ncbi:hypothetical protein NPIL_233741 [Nephila pilipes]|uniref:Uncharacterized protein n=1 Tax=Nephila pilipes TaxID=299642 RepID=A0A8X6U6N5_NEPPI|nr:hypothetical protein NPIL_233741 [Nephila pilipes]